jgi:hypothetical protein
MSIIEIPFSPRPKRACRMYSKHKVLPIVSFGHHSDVRQSAHHNVKLFASLEESERCSALLRAAQAGTWRVSHSQWQYICPLSPRIIRLDGYLTALFQLQKLCSIEWWMQCLGIVSWCGGSCSDPVSNCVLLSITYSYKGVSDVSKPWLIIWKNIDLN